MKQREKIKHNLIEALTKANRMLLDINNAYGEDYRRNMSSHLTEHLNREFEKHLDDIFYFASEYFDVPRVHPDIEIDRVKLLKKSPGL